MLFARMKKEKKAYIEQRGCGVCHKINHGDGLFCDSPFRAVEEEFVWTGKNNFGKDLRPERF